MSKSKNVLIIAGYAPSLSNFRGKLIEELTRQGWSVTVAAPDFSQFPEVIEFLDKLHVRHEEIPLVRNGMNPVKDLQTCMAIRRLIKSLSPDVVLSYTIKPVIWAGLALVGIKNVRYYALITGLGFSFQNASFARKVLGNIVSTLYKLALSSASTVMFQNDDDRSVFTSKGIVLTKKTRIVNGSGVDLEKFSQTDLPSYPPFKFLLIARLLKDKGLLEYVAAAKIVKAQYPDAEFHLVGWIDTNHEAIKQEDLDLWVNDGLIEFHGRLDDVRSIIGNCHVYVLPSYHEGTPRTVLEAMAVGRAIITTSAPGCKETVIEGYNGYLVPVQDVHALSAKMVQLIQNPETVSQMGLASREYAERKYCVNKVNQSMLVFMGMANEETI